jgi:hypothetical protein
MTHSRPARTLFEGRYHSVNVLWGANSLNTATFLLNSSQSLQSCIPTSLWHELTALYCFDESRISCKIHVGLQRSYRCSYRIILTMKARCSPVHESISNWTLFTAMPPGSIIPLPCSRFYFYHSFYQYFNHRYTVDPWLTNSIRSWGLAVTHVGHKSRLFFP